MELLSWLHIFGDIFARTAFVGKWVPMHGDPPTEGGEGTLQACRFPVQPCGCPWVCVSTELVSKNRIHRIFLAFDCADHSKQQPQRSRYGRVTEFHQMPGRRCPGVCGQDRLLFFREYLLLHMHNVPESVKVAPHKKNTYHSWGLGAFCTSWCWIAALLDRVYLKVTGTGYARILDHEGPA